MERAPLANIESSCLLSSFALSPTQPPWNLGSLGRCLSLLQDFVFGSVSETEVPLDTGGTGADPGGCGHGGASADPGMFFCSPSL